MLLDLGNVLVNLWKFWKQDREIQAWVKLVLSFTFSFFLAFTGTDGAMLIAGKAALLARGYGLVAGTSAGLTVLLRSPQGRGLILAIPQPVVAQYQGDKETVINAKT